MSEGSAALAVFFVFLAATVLINVYYALRLVRRPAEDPAAGRRRKMLAILLIVTQPVVIYVLYEIVVEKLLASLR